MDEETRIDYRAASSRGALEDMRRALYQAERRRLEAALEERGEVRVDLSAHLTREDARRCARAWAARLGGRVVRLYGPRPGCLWMAVIAKQDGAA